MRFLLLLLDLCLYRNLKKEKCDSKILFAKNKSLTKIIKVISLDSVKYLSRNCLNTLID